MNTNPYEQWVESRRTEGHDFDISDPVMESIRRKAARPGLFQRLQSRFTVWLTQTQMLAGAWEKILLLIGGGLIGLVRMGMAVYYALFV